MGETGVKAGITAMALIAAGLFVLGQSRAAPPQSRAKWIGVSILGVIGWFGVSLGLAHAGVLSNFDMRPPPQLPYMAVLMGGSIALGLSPIGKRWAQALSLPALIAMQGFRLPLELVMHEAATARIMPPQMTFTGWNYDIVTGGLALVVAGALKIRNDESAATSKMLASIWVAFAWVTLLAIAAIAILSLPLIRAFGTEPHLVNTWVTQVPYILLPAGPVAFALFGQVVIVRRLRTN